MVERRGFRGGRRGLAGFDPRVLVPALLLGLLGLLLIRSASATSALPFHLIQLRWFGVGLVLAAPLVLVPYTRLLRLAPLAFAVGILLLVAVKLFAPVVNGSQRWLDLAGFRLQPSEPMKLALILLLARRFRFGRPLGRMRDQIEVLGLALLPLLLVIAQPDLGTSLLFIPLALAVLWVGGMSAPRFALLVAGGALCAGIAYGAVLEPYQRERIRSTYQIAGLSRSQLAAEGYQLHQSLLAVASGGPFGHGHEAGPRIQAGRLPYRHNDFVLAVLAEEHGWLGSAVGLGLLLALVHGILGVARRTRDPAGRMLCVGVATLFFSQSMVHTGVVIGLLPTTGMPFPLLSYGGSALLTSIAALALVLSVARHRPSVPIRAIRAGAPL